MKSRQTSALDDPRLGGNRVDEPFPGADTMTDHGRAKSGRTSKVFKNPVPSGDSKVQVQLKEGHCKQNSRTTSKSNKAQLNEDAIFFECLNETSINPTTNAPKNASASFEEGPETCVNDNTKSKDSDVAGSGRSSTPQRRERKKTNRTRLEGDGMAEVQTIPVSKTQNGTKKANESFKRESSTSARQPSSDACQVPATPAAPERNTAGRTAKEKPAQALDDVVLEDEVSPFDVPEAQVLDSFLRDLINPFVR